MVIGQLKITSGTLAIGDGVALDHLSELDIEIKPGVYPVSIYKEDLWPSKLVIELNVFPITQYKTTSIELCVNQTKGCLVDASKISSIYAMNEKALFDFWRKGVGVIDDILVFDTPTTAGHYEVKYGYHHDLLSTIEIDFDLENLLYRYDWGISYDEGSNHCDKKEEMDLDCDDLAGFNHMAVFFEWMRDHDLLSEELKYFLGNNTEQDSRILIRDHKAFRGALCRGHFNERGQKFCNQFYLFRTGTGFPSCVDQNALDILGEKLYHCEAYKDEAYLFVPYDKTYKAGLSAYIVRAWEQFND